MLDTGARCEGYVVRSRLGEGAVAAVYEVVHEALGSVHALKVLEVAAPEARKRLIREGQAQARVRHPNLVGVTDVVRIGDCPALVLEFVDGPTLAEWLTSRPALDEALAIFRGIVRGVEAAHAAGFVHRDLKPANVLLARTPTGLVPKVSDFGLAKVLDASVEPELLSDHGIRGTPAYMAPEQHQGKRDIDERADLFALGVVLYELVTGRRPFDGPDLITVAVAACEGRFTPPEELVPDLAPAVGDTIRGLLQVDRERRIQSCGELLVRLDGRGGSRPSFDTLSLPQAPANRTHPKRDRSTSTPPPAPRRSGEVGLAGRVLVGGAVVLVVAAVVVAIVLSVAPPRVPQAPPTPAVSEP